MKIEKEKKEKAVCPVNVKKLAYSTIEAAAAVGTTPGVLANWRCQKIGPKYYRQGRRIYYLEQDLFAWITMHPVQTMDSHDLNEE